jgi:diguanylate cyclase (GGDEF)-like protein
VPSRIESAVPAIPVGLAVCVLVYRAAIGEGVGPLLSALGAALLVCLATRQFLAQLENAELTDDLETKVHELRDREDELEHRAFHDPLTGLANRDLFRNRLAHALQRRRMEPVTVVFVDLDDFKTVNDSLGHDAGDRLLVLVAERLRASVRGGDTAARLGGDEFAVLLEETEGETMGRRILAALESPFTIDGRDFVIGASIGVASGTPGITTAEELLQDADLAMYAAKAAGKSRVARFEPAMREGAVERLDLLHDLDVALDRGELVLHYQPVVRLGEQAGEVAGYEALLRWNHPERGLLSPAAFLGLAEETGRILPIGWWILEEACRAQRRFPVQPGVLPPSVSVNMSARQLADPNAIQAVAHALAVSGVDPGRVVLELPESTLLAGEEETDRLLALRALGVRLAIDDFGTGYSSLGYLSRLPIDIVKIDRSFLERMEGSGTEELLVGAIVQLARALGLRTVAEGVETRFQLDRLTEMGCDAAQGYLIGRPAPEPTTPLPHPTHTAFD